MTNTSPGMNTRAPINAFVVAASLTLALLALPRCGAKPPDVSEEHDAEAVEEAMRGLERHSTLPFARVPISVNTITEQIYLDLSLRYLVNMDVAITNCEWMEDDLLLTKRTDCRAQPDVLLQTCTVQLMTTIESPSSTRRISWRVLRQECARKSDAISKIPGRSHPRSLQVQGRTAPGEALSGMDFRPLPDEFESRRKLRMLQGRRYFKRFVKKYRKKYASRREFERRYLIFRANMMKVLFLSETERGSARYGASVFADLSDEEFRAQKLGLSPNQRPQQPPLWPRGHVADVPLPDEFDWRAVGAVTPVKNQGSCGSCWAFSVTGNIEGQWQIKNKQLMSLSEQELVDCDQLDHGCNGGLPENAYKAIVQLGGLQSEDDYSYDGQEHACHLNVSKVVVSIRGGISLPKNETQMAQWLLLNGPVSVGLNANAMQFYMGGISHPWKFLCSASNIDHGVLLVGFGKHYYPVFKKTLPFWIIKNSWGDSWGEQGYYRLFRGDGSCGIDQMASSAQLD